jgi:hypothetical protein
VAAAHGKASVSADGAAFVVAAMSVPVAASVIAVLDVTVAFNVSAGVVAAVAVAVYATVFAAAPDTVACIVDCCLLLMLRFLCQLPCLCCCDAAVAAKAGDIKKRCFFSYSLFNQLKE